MSLIALMLMYLGGYHMVWKSMPKRYSPSCVCNLHLWMFIYYHKNYACSIKYNGQVYTLYNHITSVKTDRLGMDMLC